ncbi:helix-turn-helix transcriptional regulator [Calothrix membranacea FACHB-236]|nr:helix-turn-helix transcriptional regulator [Calothrix membranacea FACHB-236]
MVAVVEYSRTNNIYFINKERLDYLKDCYLEMTAVSDAFYSDLSAAGFTKEELNIPREVLDSRDIANCFVDFYNEAHKGQEMYSKELIPDNLHEVVLAAFKTMKDYYSGEVELMPPGQKFNDERAVRGRDVLRSVLEPPDGSSMNEEKEMNNQQATQNDEFWIQVWAVDLNEMEVDYLQRKLDAMKEQSQDSEDNTSDDLQHQEEEVNEVCNILPEEQPLEESDRTASNSVEVLPASSTSDFEMRDELVLSHSTSDSEDEVVLNHSTSDRGDGIVLNHSTNGFEVINNIQNIATQAGDTTAYRFKQRTGFCRATAYQLFDDRYAYPSKAAMKRICEVYGCSPGDILTIQQVP